MSELWDRLQKRDASLWPPGNVSATRLGWLDSPARYAKEADDLRSWARRVNEQHGKVVLLGMGGSSLGPEVLRAAAATDRLIVLDTTDPRTVASVEFGDAFVLVSSKSGGTLEVQSLLAHAWERLGHDGSRFAAITDPGTSLASLARDRNFSRVFENDPNIGGRYSVLSYFGLVPGAIAGVDVADLCDRAMAIDPEEAVELGVAMGRAALEGRDKVTVHTAPTSAAFGLWVEQLIAESTGKNGRGCIPVPTTDVEEGSDRFEVAVHVGEMHDLGAEFYRWEVATAIAGHVIEVDPFDEPNVTESKENTKRVLAHLPLAETDLANPAGVTEWLTSQLTPGDYVSLQAFLPYAEADALTGLRRRVRDALDGMPVTAGFGPRYLHSTGQLHKGGPNSVVAVQFVPRHPTASLPIPGAPYDFGTLILAQALGDYQSLLDHGRRVLRVGLDHVQEVS
jgi:transaldolase/glucose-6-phosphate isomerase